jgi:hypothetical protein
MTVLLNGINRFISMVLMQCVSYEVGTNYLNVIQKKIVHQSVENVRYELGVKVSVISRLLFCN